MLERVDLSQEPEPSGSEAAQAGTQLEGSREERENGMEVAVRTPPCHQDQVPNLTSRLVSCIIHSPTSSLPFLSKEMPDSDFLIWRVPCQLQVRGRRQAQRTKRRQILTGKGARSYGPGPGDAASRRCPGPQGETPGGDQCWHMDHPSQ